MIEIGKVRVGVVPDRKLEGEWSIVVDTKLNAELDAKNYVIVYPGVYRKLKEVIAHYKRSSRKRMVRAQLRSLRKIVRRSP